MTKYESISKNEKVFLVTSKWAITIIAGAILTGMVSGAVAVGTVLNSDHFLTVANAKSIEELRRETVRLDIYERDKLGIDTGFNHMGDKLNEIQADIKEIKQRLNIL